MQDVKFCLQKISGQYPREHLAIINYCMNHGIPWHMSPEAVEGEIPVGSVEYCYNEYDRRFGINCPIDFFPKFLRNYLKRDVLLIEVYNGNIDNCALVSSRHQVGWPVEALWKIDWFVKSATVFKDDNNGFVSGTKLHTLKNDLYYITEPFNIVNEFRYYVAKGRLIDVGWYDGDDEDAIPPQLPIIFPPDFSGAVDFATTPGNNIELMESHPPFACGWYGEDNNKYAEWMIQSWASNNA